MSSWNFKGHIPIKPLTVNKAYRGRKYKSPEYKEWTEKMDLLLLKHAPPGPLPEGDLFIFFNFGMTLQNDTDNPVKSAKDRIAKHYGINDRRFRSHAADRIKQPRDGGFIEFIIKPYEEVVALLETLQGEKNGI